MTTCLSCGAEMVTASEDYAYKALPGITLADVDVSRCPECGDLEVEVPRIEELTRLLVEVVCEKRDRLNGHEVRFLRKAIGWTGKQLASHLKVTPETVSRWESGDKRIGQQADLLLRVMARFLEPVDCYGRAETIAAYLHRFPELATHAASTPGRVRLSQDPWRHSEPQVAP